MGQFPTTGSQAIFAPVCLRWLEKPSPGGQFFVVQAEDGKLEIDVRVELLAESGIVQPAKLSSSQDETNQLLAIPGLDSTAVRSLAVLVLPRLVIEAFARQAALLVTRILANAKQSRILATLRDRLLLKLLSGELSVAEAGESACR